MCWTWFIAPPSLSNRIGPCRASAHVGRFHTNMFLFSFWNDFHPHECFSSASEILPNTPGNVHHVTFHAHLACVCRCKQEADCRLCSWSPVYRKYYKRGTAVVKSRSRDFFSWSDNEAEPTVSVSSTLHSQWTPSHVTDENQSGREYGWLSSFPDARRPV